LEQVNGADLPAANAHDWPMAGGGPTRAAQAKGSPPLLDEVLWRRKTILDKSDESGEVDRGQEAKVWLNDALDRVSKTAPNMPVMPGFFPVAANGRLIYRTYNGLTAVYLKETRDNEGKILGKPGEVDWKTTELDGALASALSEPNVRGTLDIWLR